MLTDPQTPTHPIATRLSTVDAERLPPDHNDEPEADGLAPAQMRELERAAREVAAEWGLELGPPYRLARYSFVAPAGPDAVLKITPAEDDESDHEADALELWAGDGAVRLLRRDVGRRALLAERADPGTDISTLPDDEATAVAVDLGRRLWRPAGAPFRWIGDHVPGWLDQAERDGAELVPFARDLYAALNVGRATLVHGDFHHHNILRHGGGYVTIDAKAMLGEPEFDVPSFLWNPLESTMTTERTERRIAAFAAAGLDEARVRAWTVIRGAYLGADPDEARVIRGLVA
jgi:streptomycin 6-kinase